MGSRTAALAAFVLAALAVGVALVPVHAEQIHRHGFSGRQTAFLRGEANVKVDELEHDISTLSFKSQPSSEHFKLAAEAATGDAAYIHYYYDTPPAPVSELLTAGIWVKSTKPGIQLRARVVFPKEPAPDNPQLPLTALIVARKGYEKSRTWEKLTLDDVPDLINKHLPVLQARIGRAVNTADAFIDRLVLNLYTGPGTADIWVDDLDIGPVKPPEPITSSITGMPVGHIKPSPVAGAHGRLVEERGGEMMVDGRAFFFRAIRYSGTPLFVLRQAGFNSLWLPPDPSQELIEEAAREGWMVIPSLPLATATDEAGANRYVDDLSQTMRRYSGVDVLYWDLGGGKTAEQAETLYRTREAVHALDPRRPQGVDVWDGLGATSQFLDVVGSHRWPLFTSLDMIRYRDWLNHRRQLMAAGRATYWTWIQDHLPDWYLKTVLGQPGLDNFTDPVGPHPEQVRLLAYIAMACGCRGLGFWSDRFLADSHQGRDRLQGLALLNAEIDMVSPALLAVNKKAVWLPTSEERVNAAWLQGDRGSVLLPIWFGKHTQFVPEQGSVPALKIVIPLVADGVEPWRLTPAGIECLSTQTKRVVGGTEITIPEFDMAAPIVFTNDRAGILVWWQDYVRKYGRLSARWALDMAAVEYGKVHATHEKLTALGVEARDADRLFAQAAAFHKEARDNFAAEMYTKAYQGALRAMRPLRVLMSEHFRQATLSLDTPTAIPYAVSFFTLPKYWELLREIQKRRPAENLLPYGEFELAGRVPEAGVAVGTLPGWRSRAGTSDLNATAAIIPSGRQKEKVEPRKAPKPTPGIWKPGREIHPPDEGYVRPTPEMGNSLLQLEVSRPEQLDKEGKPIEPSTAPLESTFLAVDSPAVKLPPGTLVRVKAWIKVPKTIVGTADGALFYDDAGGEQLGIRILAASEWRQYHLYRVVPPSGQISVTLALTGVGKVFFDNIAIEPMVPVELGPPPADPAVQTAGARKP